MKSSSTQIQATQLHFEARAKIEIGYNNNVLISSI